MVFILMLPRPLATFYSFFFNDTAPTEIYTLSLHDALPIFVTTLLFFGKSQLVPDVHEITVLTVDSLATDFKIGRAHV